MSHKITSTALLICLVSIVVALRVDAVSPGGIGADAEMPTQTSTTSASVRQGRSIPLEAPTGMAIHADSDEDLQVIEWALGRFAAAGLELPVMEIHAHEDRTGCGDRNGYFSVTDDGEYLIRWCGNDFTILHELAHAWAEHALGEKAKAAFLEIAGADEWISDNWRHRGSEHSANVIAWGLMDARINQTRTRPCDIDSMLKAYSALTGGGEPLWISG